MRDRTDEIRQLVQKYERFEFISVRIEDAFDWSWWQRLGLTPPTLQDLQVDASSQNLILSLPPSPNSDPLLSLKSYLSSLPTATSVASTVRTLKRLLLLHVARAKAASHLVLGTSLTTLSINLISAIAQGEGFTVREEAYEEWAGAVKVCRPLQDVGRKECGAYAWWMGLTVTGREKLPDGRQDIASLTRGQADALFYGSSSAR